jgi:hypothetical protein
MDREDYKKLYEEFEKDLFKDTPRESSDYDDDDDDLPDSFYTDALIQSGEVD